MRVHFILPMIITCAIPALDYGLGIAVGNDSAIRTVSVPIRMETILVEPFGEYYNNNSEDQYAKRENKYYSIGCGVFYKKEIRQSLSLLMGGRVGINQQFDTYDSKNPSFTDNTSKSFSYSIMPSLGPDWSINEFASIGIEVGLRYNRFVYTTDYDHSSARDDSKSNSALLDSKLWFRLYF